MERRIPGGQRAESRSREKSTREMGLAREREEIKITYLETWYATRFSSVQEGRIGYLDELC